MSGHVWQQEGVVSASVVEYPADGKIIECGSKISSSMSVVSTGETAHAVEAPETGGQQFFVYMETDGGDVVLTFPATFNATQSTYTLDTTADFGLFVSVATSSGFKWYLVVNSGGSLG